MKTLEALIDFILGASAHKHTFQEKEIKNCEDVDAISVPTIFGYTVGGATTAAGSSGSLTALQVELKSEPRLNHLLTRLWELQSVLTTPRCSPDEEAALQHFRDTVRIEEDGRYSVCLPRVKDPPTLGKSRQMALSRFLGNERSLQKRGKLQAFNLEINTYLQHAEPVPAAELDLDAYYLPIHGVFKEQSTTTKVRPVFDGSARTSTGVSLNDQLLPGPALLPLITDIRLHQIAFSADVSKMFRDIQLDLSERNFHRFLLRVSDGKVKDRPFTSVISSVRRGGGKGYQHNMRAVHAVVGTVKIKLISALCDLTRLIYRLRQQVESAVLFNFIE